MPLKLVKRPGSDLWYIRGTVGGRRVFETTGTAEKRLAQEKRAQRETELYEERRLGYRAAVPFVSAALAFLEFEERSTTTENDVQRLADHFGHTDIASIGQAEADLASTAIYGTRAAPATKARHIYTPLIAVLSFGAQRKWCEKPSIKKPKVAGGKTRWLTPAEAVALLREAAPHLKPMLRFILCTGARMSEALDLQWSDVDLAGARAILRDTKTGVDRVAALTPAAVVALANIPFTDEERQVREGSVFLTDDGLPYASRDRDGGGQIKTAWHGACLRAGLAEVVLDEKGKPVLDAKERPVRVHNATPHDLRHTWATYFYALTKDLLLLKAEGAWETLSMVERYAHLMPAHMVDQIHSIWGASHPRIGALPTENGAKLVQSSDGVANNA